METETQKELEWKETIEIPNGEHTGVITKVGFRDEPFSYTDVFVKLDNVDIELRYGCPTIITQNSKLGRLLITLGEQYEKGKKVDVVKALTGRKIKFMTLTKRSKKNPNKSYAEIVEDSIKPL